MRDVFLARTALGDKPLLICDGETLTYTDADERSNRVASTLIEYGVGKGDVVATFMYNSVDHAAVWYACVKLGAIFASLNVSLAPNELVYSLGDTNAKVLIVDNDLIDVYKEARPNFTHQPVEILWRGSNTDGLFPSTTSMKATMCCQMSKLPLTTPCRLSTPEAAQACPRASGTTPPLHRSC